MLTLRSTRSKKRFGDQPDQPREPKVDDGNVGKGHKANHNNGPRTKIRTSTRTIGRRAMVSLTRITKATTNVSAAKITAGIKIREAWARRGDSDRIW